MKNVLCLTVCALSFLALASTAQASGAEANGDFDFGIEGATGTVIFDAGINSAGGVHGQMSFTATVDVGDPEGAGDPVPTNVVLTAQFDCMFAHANRAAMSGVITSANVPDYVGQRTTLVVEDGVEGITPTTDAFAWGVYRPTDPEVHARLLAAQDYEYCPAADPESEFSPPCDTDPGTTLTWTASDYELCPAATEEDPNPPCTPDPGAFTAGLSTTPAIVDCESFALSAYPLNLIGQGGGNKVLVTVDN